MLNITNFKNFILPNIKKFRQTILLLYKFLILVIVIGIFFLHSHSTQASSINIKPDSNKIDVKSSILVNDAEVCASVLLPNSTNLENSQLKKNLQEIIIGKISEPLGQLILEKSKLVKILGQYADYFNLPQRIYIRRKGKLIPKNIIEEKIKQLCLSDFQNQSHNQNFEIIINTSHLPNYIIVSDEFENFDITPISNNKLGMRIFALEINSKYSKDKKIIQAYVHCKVTAARLIKFKKKNETISKDDIQPVDVIIKIDGQQIPPTYEYVIGKVLKTYKSPSTIISYSDLFCSSQQNCILLTNTHKTYKDANNLFATDANIKFTNEKSYAVKAGDIVDFIVVSGNLTLKVPARALQSGAIGTKIKLINLKNNKEISGIISDVGKVECEIN